MKKGGERQETETLPPPSEPLFRQPHDGKHKPSRTNIMMINRPCKSLDWTPKQIYFTIFFFRGSAYRNAENVCINTPQNSTYSAFRCLVGHRCFFSPSGFRRSSSPECTQTATNKTEECGISRGQSINWSAALGRARTGASHHPSIQNVRSYVI